ncbi:hypothetical protein LOTGIDRAFT_166797 [Lottia gigantea]|uniref:Glutamate-rich protein 2 n=1 Tax=Lottia gigantea TaxID=225164 RepID=V4A0K5_LOTGI|nr:hypothetical protein LOTGIDRAFT_166797 [Lottia gigantea]ESO86796.1 hypothetical protein LOTGIDRAFT_166797 [Lottia gigantea]
MATRISQDKTSTVKGEISSARIGIKRETSSGTLEIFGENNFALEDSASNNFDKRPGKVPPRPDSRSSLGQSTPTSTKQISLQTVRRKNNSEDDVQVLDLETNTEGEDRLNERLEKLNLSGRNSRNFLRENSSQELTKEKEIQNDETSSENEDDDDDDEDDDEKPKAPNELFMEFLTCIMNKDYPTAKKLCRMILIYEPQHEEALKFQNLIEEKILLDQEPDVSDSEDEERESGHELDSGNSGDSNDDSEDTRWGFLY